MVQYTFVSSGCFYLRSCLHIIIVTPLCLVLFSHRPRHQPSPAATISMVISKVASGDINTSMQAFVQVWRVHVEHIPYQCTGVSFVLVCRCLDDVVGYRFGVEQDATKS